MPSSLPDNREIARQLDEVGRLLESQGANPFRFRAYRAAAQTVRRWDSPVSRTATDGGHRALEALPHIGRGIAAAILEIVDTGRLRLLDNLEGEVCPEKLLASVPGIGSVLAKRIHEALHIETLEDLELAAHDGRLATLPGFGVRRLVALRAVLSSMLRRGGPLGVGEQSPGVRPAVADVLAIDAEYRSAAQAQTLPMIAPRRFNPQGRAWLPILHTDRGGFHFTALYSNTARAHRLGHTHDWVVVFYEREGERGQHTVVTEHRGPLKGHRVVRGRERECAAHHADGEADPCPGRGR